MRVLFFIFLIFFTDSDGQSISLENLNFSDGTWRRGDNFQTLEELTAQLPEKDGVKVQNLIQQEDQLMQRIDRKHAQLEKGTTHLIMGMLNEVIQKLRVYIRYNLFFSIALNCPPDDVLIESIMKSLEKQEDIGSEKFNHLLDVVNKHFREMMILTMIFDDDYAFAIDDALKCLRSKEQHKITPHFLIFSGIILGKTHFYHMLSCENIPRGIEMMINILTHKANVEKSLQGGLTQETSQIKMLYFKIIASGDFFPKNGPLTYQQSLLKPFFDACYAVAKRYGTSKGHLLRH